MSTSGGALQLAPDKKPRPWIIWVLAGLGVLLLGVVARQIYVQVGKATAGGAEEQELSPQLRATIDQLKAFIEKERGLKFKKEVKVTLLTENEFRDLVTAPGELDPEGAEALANDQSMFEALRLVPKGVRLDDVGSKAAGQGIIGYYDSESDEMVIRGNEVTPFLKTVLVHELTHALQDQHFDIHRPELYETDDDSGLAFDAVIEGDAQRIEYAYYESLTAEEERLIELEANKAGDPATPDIPPAMIKMFSFPYEVGPSFMDALFQAGGRARMDAAFKTPPTTAEQLIYPELYLRGEGAKPVAKPPADGDVFGDGMFGQMALLVILTEGMDFESAVVAADGWGGDQYVAWRTGDRSCVRFDMVMDSPLDQRELNTGLRSWAKAHGSATVATAGGATRMTACA